MYEGEYNEEGEKHGHGLLKIPNCGLEYVGDFKQGKIHGRGTVTYSDGRKNHGMFKEGQLINQDD